MLINCHRKPEIYTCNKPVLQNIVYGTILLLIIIVLELASKQNEASAVIKANVNTANPTT